MQHSRGCKGDGLLKVIALTSKLPKTHLNRLNRV
jgi:hypothetical protein